MAVDVEEEAAARMEWTPEELAVHSKSPHTDVTQFTDEVHTKPTMSSIDKKFPQALEWSQKIKEQKFRLVVKIASSRWCIVVGGGGANVGRSGGGTRSRKPPLLPT